jgi:hypothetical protein
MKTKNLLFLLLMLAALLSCGQKETGQADTEADAISTLANRDSLYQHYFAEKPNEYPTKAVLEKGKLYPEDQAVLDSSFLIYRGQLLDAIQNKDLIALLPLLDQNIKCSFGDCQGKAGFAEMWHLDTPDKGKASPLWAELESVLIEGGSFNGERRFTAPYIFTNWPESYDAFEYAVIAGRMVRMRAEPRLGASIVTNLTYDIVKVVNTNGPDETIDGETHRWIQLETLDGKAGHVWGKFVASPIDFRAGFEQRDGRWKMIFFLAGD